MSPLERLAQSLSETLVRTEGYAPLVLFFGSFVEYVFPPFPGDTLVLLGAWYAVNGVLSWPVTFLAVTAGALAGAYLDWRAGVALGRRIDRSVHRKGGLTEERLLRFEAGYRRFGAWLLVLNRFLPGVRAFFFLAAGACGIPLRQVLLYGGISAAVWNALLLAAGGLLVRNLDELLQLGARYTSAAWLAMAAVAALLLARALLGRRASREERP
ncbi:MAG TPA: DedA family protein [Anaeromyxobacteraceae bacterium]|nr:DedA family protein [Anaeromyxobacteraceae bacterium]